MTRTNLTHSHVWPSTRLGWVSLGFLGVFVAALGFMMVAAVSGQTGGNTFTDNWWLAGPAFTAAAGAFVAMSVAVAAVFACAERTWSVLLAIPVGGLVTLFVLAELIGSAH
jgi:hypothetical protein